MNLSSTFSPTTFNATVCLIGVLILLVHIINLLLKKDRRKDENHLLNFFAFTMIHFLTYFIFTMIKEVYVSDAFIITFYTIFYIMNNVEVMLFYLYMSNYTNIENKSKKAMDIINITLFSLFVVSDIVNIFTRMYFTSDGGVYERTPFMIIAQGYQLIMLAAILVLAIFNKTLNRREKIAFSLYCLLPLVAVIVQVVMAGYAIAYLTLLLAIEFLFLFLTMEKNIQIKEDQEKLKEANVRIMVSQIQPHFIYNTLSSISTLIPINQRQAQKALDDFAEYLRVNFSTLTSTKLVSFNDELKHTQTYVNLEKMRFGDRLHVIYDIKTTDFFVPPLSIQPLVENAIKHGILKKEEGGVLLLRTYEDDNAYVVEVKDDGVGFDYDSVDFKNNKHIGLNNVKQRITTMCNGSVNFISKPYQGTLVIVKFYKTKK